MTFKNTTFCFIIVYIAVVFVFAVLFTILKLKVDKTVVKNTQPIYFRANCPESDSILATLTLNEKIKQLFILDFGLVSDNDLDSMYNKFVQFNGAGLIIRFNSVYTHQKFSAKYHSETKIPLFLGLSTHVFTPDNFTNIVAYPSDTAMLSLSDTTLVGKLFENMAKQYKNMGINLALTPVNYMAGKMPFFDSNYVSQLFSNQLNYIQKTTSESILSIQNSTTINSPDTGYIHATKQFFPEFVSTGLGGIFTDFSNTPDTIEIGYANIYSGLRFARISDKRQLAMAFSSGYDIFISNLNPDTLLLDVLDLVKFNHITEADIDARLKRSLKARCWIGKQKIADSVQLKKLFSGQHISQAAQALKKSVTLLRNSNNILPVKSLINRNFLILTAEPVRVAEFAKYFMFYHPVVVKKLPSDTLALRKLLAGFKNFEIILVTDSIFSDSVQSKFLNSIKFIQPYIVVNFSKDQNFQYFANCGAIVHCYNNKSENQKIAAQALFGGFGMEGRYPFYFSATNSYFSGNKTQKIRLEFAYPEEAGLSTDKINKIDSIALAGVSTGAYPGCQIYVAMHGKIVYLKALGYSDYGKNQRVELNSVYDIASVTKIAATTMAAMKMIDLGKMQLTDPLGKFFKNTYIQYSRIKPDTVIRQDTLNLALVKDFKKLLHHADTIHLNDSVIVVTDTLIKTLTPKNNIFTVTLRELLLHQSGIVPALPILPFLMYKQNWLAIVNPNNKTKPEFRTINMGTNGKNESINFLHTDTSNNSLQLKSEYKKAFEQFYSTLYLKDSASVEIAENMYFKKNAFDTLWSNTKQLPVYSKKLYEYSDVNMILLQLAIDSANNNSINKFVEKEFYAPLGLQTIGYKPLQRFAANRIMPTEDDLFWRAQMLRGYVHDPSAALLGGIAGNAGLFSDALDLGILFQMLVNGGFYGGRSYLSTQTVKLFTSRAEGSHRGLGFDMKTEKAYMSQLAGENTYGHTGFTGTCVWVDPDAELVYVFLANRVHPNMKNYKINTYKIRQQIHEQIYMSIYNQ